jgi:hypothetical protein
VAATLESRWDAALRFVNEIRARLETLRGERSAHPLPDRAILLGLAWQFEKVWHHPAGECRKFRVREP